MQLECPEQIIMKRGPWRINSLRMIEGSVSATATDVYLGEVVSADTLEQIIGDAYPFRFAIRGIHGPGEYGDAPTFTLACALALQMCVQRYGPAIGYADKMPAILESWLFATQEVDWGLSGVGRDCSNLDEGFVSRVPGQPYAADILIDDGLPQTPYLAGPPLINLGAVQ